eukprot:4911509-Amphidinium_carterae.1
MVRFVGNRPTAAAEPGNRFPAPAESGGTDLAEAAASGSTGAAGRPIFLFLGSDHETRARLTCGKLLASLVLCPGKNYNYRIVPIRAFACLIETDLSEFCRDVLIESTRGFP